MFKLIHVAAPALALAAAALAAVSLVGSPASPFHQQGSVHAAVVLTAEQTTTNPSVTVCGLPVGLARQLLGVGTGGVDSTTSTVHGTDGSNWQICQFSPKDNPLHSASLSVITGPKALIASWYRSWLRGAAKIKGVHGAFMMAGVQPTAFMMVHSKLLQLSAAARPSPTLKVAIAKAMSILQQQLA